jgi:hypothetical protein
MSILRTVLHVCCTSRTHARMHIEPLQFNHAVLFSASQPPHAESCLFICLLACLLAVVIAILIFADLTLLHVHVCPRVWGWFCVHDSACVASCLTLSAILSPAPAGPYRSVWVCNVRDPVTGVGATGALEGGEGGEKPELRSRSVAWRRVQRSWRTHGWYGAEVDGARRGGRQDGD